MNKSPLLGLILVLVFSGVGSVACANATPRLADPLRTVACPRAQPRAALLPAGSLSPQVFATLDEAVGDALKSARCASGPESRGRLRFGTIRQVEGGYAWTAPVAADEEVVATAPVRLALSVARDDVAIYGIHPRSGRPELDRANEALSRSERALVEGESVRARVLYVLTPSRRIVRHAAAGFDEPVEPIALRETEARTLRE